MIISGVGIKCDSCGKIVEEDDDYKFIQTLNLTGADIKDLSEKDRRIAVLERALQKLAKIYTELHCEHYCKNKPCDFCENGHYEFIIENLIEQAEKELERKDGQRN